MTIKPPPSQVNAPLIHKVCEFYKKTYLLSYKIPKRDKLGICLKTENICLELMTQIIQAAFESKQNKLPILAKSRIYIELLKNLFRVVYELNIISDFKYIELESNLQEISMMTNGWIKYLTAAH